MPHANSRCEPTHCLLVYSDVVVRGMLCVKYTGEGPLLNGACTTWRKPSDGSWGMFENDSWSVVGKDSLNKTQRHGSWNGMIGMIQRQEVEVAINEFAMTSLRLNVVDFTVPLLATK
uniref:Ionotropic glutamate receptor L-glutamate and glycine-binding domain-containing protein n=1 Tax=Timema poppense TaxID=170557 RepID=A0A7R9DYN8_TIMPO|nr:unnamed protein product [Timema poppensis]